MASSANGTGWGVLSQRRLQAIIETVTAQKRIDARLTFLGRTPITPVATDADLLGDFDGEVFAADIISDDQQAVTYDMGKFNFFNSEIGNIKHGILLGQKQLNELNNLRNRGDEAARFMGTWLARRQSLLLLGIRQRLESLIVSCYRDNTIYDRYGIKINGTWGMPIQLKYVAPVPWNEHDDATPVSDLQFMINEVAPDMNTEFTIVSMSRKLFSHMVMCKEFSLKAKIVPSVDLQLNFLFPDGALPNAYDPRMIRLAEAVIGCQFEFYDTKITTKNSDGSKTSTRNLPHNEILLHSPAVWNNPEVLDLGNAVVTESLVAEFTQTSVVGGIPANAYGPLPFAAPTTLDLNSPGMTYWTVQRAFPRKFDKNATGFIDTGVDPVTGD